MTSATMEGYLSARIGIGITGKIKMYSSRWYFVENNQLCYRKHKDDAVAVVVEADLRLCLVRPMLKKNCFEVISPTNSQGHVLKAGSAEAAKAWVSGLEASIKAALGETVKGTYVTRVPEEKDTYVYSNRDEEDEKEARKTMAKQGRSSMTAF